LNKLVLELDSRRRIFDAIREYPGMHLREIGREVRLAPNLVDYHLIYLEKRGFVYSLHDGKYKRYFLRDCAEEVDKGNIISAPDSRIVSLLRRKVPFQITLLILKNGPMTHGAIVESMRRSPSTISHHLNKLMKAGIISRVNCNSGYVIRDCMSVERILLRFNPQPITLVDGFLEIWEDFVL